MNLFSYVMDHDYGFSPNPYYGVCTLAHCKHKNHKNGPRNIVEMAEIGDWIVGTGGVKRKLSAGNGKIIYAMKVEEKLTLGKYYRTKRFRNKRPQKDGTYIQQRGDNFYSKDWEKKNRFVLISHRFYYFGRNAIAIPRRFRNYPLEKKGPGYRRNFDDKFIQRLVNWFANSHKIGRHGDPCAYKDTVCKGRNECK
jgi:hypothetical protein